MPKVLYDPKKETPSRTGAVGFDELILQPGINELDKDAIAKLKAHPDFPGYEESGAISFPPDKEPAKASSKDPEAAKTTKSGNKPETEVQ